VTSASTRPTDVGQGIGIKWEGHDEEFLSIRYAMVDYDFFKTFDMEVVQGRSFSKTFALDETEACIINETALREMGIESPIGKDVYCWLPAGLDESFRYVKIIGVVKDFHFRSMHEAIGPFLFRMYRPWHHFVFIRIRSDDIQETLLRIERIFKRFAPEYPFQYEFLDEAFNRLYQSERQMGRLFNVFGFLAVLISCLGLFGLASYTAEQKTKEIGVRKVLGASVSEIILLLSKEFTRWVLIANVIAWPVCYFIMNRWLQNFAYKTRIGIETFMLSGMIAFFIALLTVSYQSVKAAQANPAESLKYE
jgi:putative ABC transport system permease protein